LFTCYCGLQFFDYRRGSWSARDQSDVYRACVF
jgi:hypothetical protein